MFYKSKLTNTKKKGIKIRWEGDWNGNYDLKDQNFYDLPHFEAVVRRILLRIFCD